MSPKITNTALNSLLSIRDIFIALKAWVFRRHFYKMSISLMLLVIHCSDGVNPVPEFQNTVNTGLIIYFIELYLYYKFVL